MCAATRPLVIALRLSCVAVSAMAADTGTVSGAVFDQDGQPVADATVKISGRPLPIGRTVQTGANGIYQFQYLPPGEYVVEIDKAGVGRATRAAIVEVGQGHAGRLRPRPVVQEELTVTAARPIVDIRSAEVSFNFRADTLNSLPLERTYRGLFQLIPGVADNRSSVGPAAGGSRQDNTYLIDGANITSPAFGYLSTEVNELDIAEVNLKRGGHQRRVRPHRRHAWSTRSAAAARTGFRASAASTGCRSDLVGGYKLPDDLLDAGVQPGTFRDALLTTRDDAGRRARRSDRPRTACSSTGRRATRARRNGIASTRSATPLPDEVRTGPEFFGKLTSLPAPAASADRQLSSPAQPRRQRRDSPRTLRRAWRPTTDNGSRIATAEWANFIGRAQLAQRALPPHEGEQRGRAGHRSGISAAVRSPQPAGDGPVHRSDAGEPRRSAATSSRTSRTTGGTRCAARSASSSTSAEPATR